ncbi:MAG: hypothetical protein UU41_C0022G0001, partial [Candidatus Roizmanbacteria bacterium GW2011_GWA1_41_13]
MAASLFNVGRYFSKSPTPNTTSGSSSDTPPADPSQSTDSQPSTTTSSVSTTETVQANAVPANQSTQSSTPSPALEQEQDKTPLQKRAGMDVLSRLTQRSNKALVSGVTKAKELKVPMVDTEYV